MPNAVANFIARHAAVIAVLLGGAYPALPAATAAPGLRLEQNSEYFGDMVTEINPSLIRIKSGKRYNFWLEMHAPEFSVIGINHTAHTYLRVDYATWHTEVNQRLRRHNGTLVDTHQDVVIAGIKTRRYLFNNDSRDLISDSPASTYKGVCYNTAAYFAKSVADVPKPFAEILTSVADLPSLGLLLRMEQYGAHGHITQAFNTVSAHQVADIDGATAVPPDYKQCANEMALIAGDGANTDFARSVMEDTAGGGDSKTQLVRTAQRLRRWVPGLPDDCLDGRDTSVQFDEVKTGTWDPKTGW